MSVENKQSLPHSNGVETDASTPASDYQLFGLTWLDSCYHQTLLPNGPWQNKVCKRLCDNLAQHVRRQTDIATRRQILFEMLGRDFMRQYFPEIEYTPEILEEPLVSADERKKLEYQAAKWLQHAMDLSIAETACQRPSNAQANGTEISEEMREFLEHSRHLVEVGLDRHMYCLDRQIKRALETKNARQGHPRGRVLNSSASTVLPSRNSVRSENDEHQPSQLFWGHQSNLLGKSVVAILRRDPRRFAYVVSQLHGRQLSGTLRMYIWMDVLQRRERAKLNDIQLEKMLRERFAKAVSRGLADLKISNATHSPIDNVIGKAVKEIYDGTPSMRLFMKKSLHMQEAIKALNVLYVYDRTYEPYLVYWLFPLQLAFQQESGESEHTYELAMYLDLLNKGCFPKWPEIFCIAENVMRRINTADQELHDHLKSIAKIKPKVNHKEFVAHLIRRERQSGVGATDGTDDYDKSSSWEFLADPLIFLRKWVGEGFVGILDTPGVVYAWDQCFMQGWNPRVHEDFCLTIVLLLRQQFMQAVDYSTMRQVFLTEPCKLYTADIQKGWIHLQQQGSPSDVPAMNRFAARLTTVSARGQNARIPSRMLRSEPQSRLSYAMPSQRPQERRKSIVSNDVGTASRQYDDVASDLLNGDIGPVAIRDVIVKIVVTKSSMLNNESLRSMKAANFRLTCIMCFGSVQMRTKVAVLPAVMLDERIDKSGTKTYTVHFSTQRFIFHSMDLSEYDLEQEMGGYPNAVLQVSYAPDSGGNDLVLGWALIQLYRQKGYGESVDWEMTPGDQVCSLNSGVPFVDDDDDVPAVIGPGSELRATVYEPLPAARDQ